MYRSLAGDGIIRRLLDAAGAAPSIHNTQPWRFRAFLVELAAVFSVR
jgi:nitroreductase